METERCLILCLLWQQGHRPNNGLLAEEQEERSFSIGLGDFQPARHIALKCVSVCVPALRGK